MTTFYGWRNYYYLADDCDTLLCKLQNIADDYYLHDRACDIDKIEADIDRLQNAIDNNDRKAMQALLNNYFMLFKRYR